MVEIGLTGKQRTIDTKEWRDKRELGSEVKDLQRGGPLLPGVPCPSYISLTKSCSYITLLHCCDTTSFSSDLIRTVLSKEKLPRINSKQGIHTRNSTAACFQCREFIHPRKPHCMLRVAFEASKFNQGSDAWRQAEYFLGFGTFHSLAF